MKRTQKLDGKNCWTNLILSVNVKLVLTLENLTSPL